MMSDFIGFLPPSALALQTSLMMSFFFGFLPPAALALQTSLMMSDFCWLPPSLRPGLVYDV